MKKIAKIVRDNLIFVLITITVVLVAFISKNIESGKENPFADSYYLENPVKVATSKDFNIYLLDSSYTLALTNADNELVKLIYGGDFENTFDYAYNIVIGNDGSFYVHDMSFGEDGSTMVSERIIKFSQDGGDREVVFEVDYTAENVDDTAFTDYMTVIDGVLYFATINESGIAINKCESGTVTTCNKVDIEDANLHITGCTFKDENGIMAVWKNGDVYRYKDGKSECVFNAREHDNDEYVSIITEIGYGKNGELYLNDTGQRKVYVLSEDKLEVAIDMAFFLEDKPERFPENPIYSGLYTQGDTVSVLSEQYEYDEDAQEAYYSYYICTVSVSDSGKEVIFYGDSIGISFERRAIVFGFWAALVALAVIAVYSFIRIIKMLKNAEYGEGKLQIVALITAIAVTVLVTYLVFDSSDQRYIDESADNLSNIAYLIEATIDKEALAKIDSPDDYDSEEFYIVDENITEVLNSQTNGNKNIYCVLYRATKNLVCQLYSDDYLHGPLYPLAGVYEGSIEEGIANDGSCYVSYDMAISEGSYTFALIPIYDDAGGLIAFVEVGMNYDLFARENDALFKNVLLLAATAVIIVMLLFSEIMYGVRSFKERKKSIENKTILSPDVMRPVAFMLFFVANITTAFLPIYGASLWNENFPMQKELAAAFPLSAELVLSAATAFLCGFIIKKTGIKLMSVLGAMFYIGGNLFSAFAGNLWIFIVANSLCGIGGGMLMIALNTWITGYEEEDNQNKGFIHYNAAFLAGMNCGTVVGSLMWEEFGTTTVFIFAAICSAVLIAFILLLLDNRKVVEDENDKGGAKLSELKEFFKADIIKYFICLIIPYLICASFLSYFFPIVAENNQLTALEISMAFLISGVISIYASSVIGELAIEKLGVKRSMILASFIYAIALIHLAINPSITNCYVVIVLFAIADSFGMSAQSVYYAALPGVKKIGNSKALGINNTVEAIASALGPVIFGALLMMGEQKGIFIIATAFTILLLLFFVSTKTKHKN